MLQVDAYMEEILLQMKELNNDWVEVIQTLPSCMRIFS